MTPASTPGDDAVIYLVGQIWGWLLIALVLGVVIGWLWNRLRAGSRIEEALRPWRERVTALETERDQLRRELAEARDRATEREAELAALRGEAPPQIVTTTVAGPAVVPAGEEAAAAPIPAAENAAETAAPAPEPSPAPVDGTALVAPEPALLSSAPAESEGDDLTRIHGIGRALEARLKGLGISTYSQIAALTEEDIQRIDAALGFKGRVTRDRWIPQAQALLAGQEGR
jgi:predicted flap endonuclease-1-like 5' DNA nuclease